MNELSHAVAVEFERFINQRAGRFSAPSLAGFPTQAVSQEIRTQLITMLRYKNRSDLKDDRYYALAITFAKDYLPGNHGFNYLICTRDEEMLPLVYRLVRDVQITHPDRGDIIYGFIADTVDFISNSPYRNEYGKDQVSPGYLDYFNTEIRRQVLERSRDVYNRKKRFLHSIVLATSPSLKR